MAAFTGTPASSARYASQIGTTTRKKQYGGQHKETFTYTHVLGAGTGEVNLIKLPGQIRIFSLDCRIEATVMVATADLHLGFRAYTQPDGTVVAEDDNAFLDNADVGGGAISSAWLLPAVTAALGPGISEFNALGSIIIYAMVDTANMEDTDVISGYVAWAEVGS